MADLSRSIPSVLRRRAVLPLALRHAAERLDEAFTMPTTMACAHRKELAGTSRLRDSSFPSCPKRAYRARHAATRSQPEILRVWKLRSAS